MKLSTVAESKKHFQENLFKVSPKTYLEVFERCSGKQMLRKLRSIPRNTSVASSSYGKVAICSLVNIL